MRRELYGNLEKVGYRRLLLLCVEGFHQPNLADQGMEMNIICPIDRVQSLQLLESPERYVDYD